MDVLGLVAIFVAWPGFVAIAELLLRHCHWRLVCCLAFVSPGNTL